MSIQIAKKAESRLLQTRETILAAEACLQRSSFPEFRLVFCTFSDGILTLSGTVSSPFLRRLAPSIVQSVKNVDAVENQLVVSPAGQSGSGAPRRLGAVAFSPN